MKLNGQVAIVVGSARGIGAAIAHRFSQEGANVVLVDLAKMKPQLDEVAREIAQKGGKAMALVADCTNGREVNTMVDETIGRWGKIDILINSAGLRGPLVPVQELTEQEWDAVLAVNLKAVFLCCKAVLKVMMKQKAAASSVSLAPPAKKVWRCAALSARPNGGCWD
jgi:3-oxoacyl-[acyl-carrier protein] reductase